jgi:hypothetical protein
MAISPNSSFPVNTFTKLPFFSTSSAFAVFPAADISFSSMKKCPLSRPGGLSPRAFPYMEIIVSGNYKVNLKNFEKTVEFRRRIW